MKPLKDRPGNAAKLRQQAEKALLAKDAALPETLKALSPEEIRKELHDLRVHQIELEMQNDELRRLQAELESIQSHYFDLYNLAPVGYCTLSQKGLILQANLTAATLLGMARGAFLKQPIFSHYILKRDQDIYFLLRKKLMDTHEPQSCELRMLNNMDGGSVFWVQLEAASIQEGDSAPVLRVVIIDISERKQAEAALAYSEERLREVLENSLDASYKRNLQTNSYEYLSPVFARLTGYTPVEMKTLPLENVLNMIHPDDRAEVERVISQSLTGVRGTAYQVEYRFKHKEGQTRWFHDQFVVMQDADGNPLARIGSVSDVTDRRHAKDALEAASIELENALAREKELSRTDPLTGVSNRRHLYENAERAFGVAARYHQPLTVILFDIDHFKQVNDTFGHAVGDLMLQRVTRAAREELRSADLIGRYGGEEFVILMPMTNAEQGYPLAERIRTSVEAIRQPTAKGDIAVTLSIGIFEMLPELQTESVEVLIRRADEAMYQAKLAGRNRTEIWTGSESGSIP